MLLKDADDLLLLHRFFLFVSKPFPAWLPTVVSTAAYLQYPAQCLYSSILMRMHPA
jgi:hypothetical protein